MIRAVLITPWTQFSVLASMCMGQLARAGGWGDEEAGMAAVGRAGRRL